MQRDHTDSQFRSLSENLETQEARGDVRGGCSQAPLVCSRQAKLEGARGALLRHEKVTAEQARWNADLGLRV